MTAEIAILNRSAVTIEPEILPKKFPNQFPRKGPVMSHPRQSGRDYVILRDFQSDMAAEEQVPRPLAIATKGAEELKEQFREIMKKHLESITKAK